MVADKPQKPKIDYPCKWGYKVIGEIEEKIREAVAECLTGCFVEREFELEVSRASGSKKYISLNLSITVADEQERIQLFQALANSPHIMMVI